MVTTLDSNLDSGLTLRDDVLEVNRLIQDVLAGGPGDVGAAARHVSAVAGKGLRIRTALLAGSFGEPDRDSLLRVAASVELVHVASLVHDDIMDRGLVRRSMPTVNALWGDGVALLTGDFILARAAHLVAGLGEPVARVQSTALLELVAGQAAELAATGTVPTIADHLETLRLKTATLFTAAVDLAAAVGRPSEPHHRALRAWAAAYGVAFQLVDDLVDLAESSDAGKSAQRDLANGVVTAPALCALARGGDDACELRRLVTGRGPSTDAEVARVRALASRLGGVTATRGLVAARRTEAGRALAELPETPARAELDAMWAPLLARAERAASDVGEGWAR